MNNTLYSPLDNLNSGLLFTLAVNMARLAAASTGAAAFRTAGAARRPVGPVPL
jgi:hypothetical protein